MPNKKPDKSPKGAKKKAPAKRAVEPAAETAVNIPVTVKSKAAAAPPQPPADQPTAPPLPGRLLSQLPQDEPAAKTAGHPSGTAIPPAGSLIAPTDASTVLDDSATDKAVDDIVAKEGDIVLAVEDATAARRTKPQPRGWKTKLRALLKNKWTWIAVAALLLAVFAVPFTRYKILGLVIKKPVTLIIIDSKTMTPVSNAQVQLGGQAGKTDGSGRARLNAPVGPRSVVITKQYYKTATASYFVGFRAGSSPKIKLVATGRLVPLTIINKITGQPLKGAEIRVLGTTGKTDSRGRASIALPAATATAAASVKLAGYNQAKINLQVTDQIVKANSFELTPAGRLYFLSNQNGSLDVVRANLDGSDRHMVLAGTGREEKNTTSLLASRDWRYLVLKARREGTQPALYLIDTSNDTITEFDTSDSAFELVGWYGHNFIYRLTKNGLPNWQAGREALKSYDADNQQLNQLDQNQAEGDASSYAYQSFANFYLVNGAVVYNTEWYASHVNGSSHDLGGKNNAIRAVQPNGQNKKDYQPLPSDTASYTRAVLYEPGGVYYEVQNSQDNKRTYYAYEDQAVRTATGIDQTNFNQPYPTYLFSPSGNQTFWTDQRDGKNALFVGDAAAKNPRQLASLAGYVPYGWYSDAYTLVSKNGSELFIMPASGAKTTRPPLKITDYYKPAQTYSGYGYGYGGL